MRKGAEIVLQCLRAEGVDLVFGYPGGAIMPLYDALDGSGVRHILTRHEQGAVSAAEAVAARLPGRAVNSRAIRLHRLDILTAPADVPGRSRRAGTWRSR